MPKFGKHSRLLLPEIIVLIVLIFLAGMAFGYLSARAKYKGDLIAAMSILNANADKTQVLSQMIAIHEVDGGVVLRNTQVYTVKDDSLEKMTTPTYLKDGTRVNVDGGVVRTNGASFKLIDGMGMDANGKALIVFPIK